MSTGTERINCTVEKEQSINECVKESITVALLNLMRKKSVFRNSCNGNCKNGRSRKNEFLPKL